MDSILAVLRQLLRTLTIPFGADPNAPAIFLGADVPAALAAYYAAISGTVNSAIIYRLDSDDYLWMANVLTAGGNAIRIGASSAGTLREIGSYIYGGGVYGVRFQDVVSSGQIIVALGEYQMLIGGGAPADLYYNGIPQEHGFHGIAGSLANSAAIGAEAVVLTDPFTRDFLDGRAYWFEYGGQVNHSAAQVASFRLRKDTLAGAVVAGAFNHQVQAAENTWQQAGIIATNTTGATISFAPCLTLQASAGTATHAAAASRGRYLRVKDIGSALLISPLATALT